MSRVTLDTPSSDIYFAYETVTLFRPPFQVCSTIYTLITYGVLNPIDITTYGLGCYHFARHYFGNRLFTFFSSGYLDVSVPQVPLITLCIHVMILIFSYECVPAFGHPRIRVHLQLPVAFRSLSRPSSAPDAKASTIRSY